MRFTPTRLSGAFILDPERREDARGHFARTFCRREFEAHGLRQDIAQANIAWNARKGTLRGMHYQVAPAAETKLVRCPRGALWDVIVDLRPDSPTFLEHVGVELSAENGRQLFVPELFAHGYITLADDTEAAYQVGEFYAPEAERGIRYDDPALGISWPVPVEVISDKDASWPDFVPARAS
jgi:dTDP-4-dehydrorhamnose 3,5-epimerase